MNILLADDEKPLLSFLSRGLRSEGYECTSLNELHEVLPFIKKNAPQIVVLDRLFGSQDSLTILESIKALPTPPMVLMLTALDEVSERVKGLEMGADDYLCKPFDFDELLLYMAENQNKVLSRERILSRVWQTYSDPNTNIVDVYISRLRKKLEADQEISIQTLRGNGYRMALK